MDDDDNRLEELLADTKPTSEPSNRSVALDTGQGNDDERTDTDNSSVEGAQESLTPPSSKNSSGAASPSGRQATEPNPSIDEAILYGKKYLEDLLSFFGLNTDIHATTEDGEVIELDIPSTHLNGFLIGHNGDTVRALQYTISNALKAQNFSHTRVNVDVAEYKKQKNERLAKVAEDWFKEVKTTGKPKDLQPMNAAERRVVHQAATDYGLTTESVGFGRDRHIVLKPGEDSEDAETTPPPTEE